MYKLIKYLTKLEELEESDNIDKNKEQIYIYKINYYFDLIGGTLKEGKVIDRINFSDIEESLINATYNNKFDNISDNQKRDLKLLIIKRLLDIQKFPHRKELMDVYNSNISSHENLLEKIENIKKLCEHVNLIKKKDNKDDKELHNCHSFTPKKTRKETPKKTPKKTPKEISGETREETSGEDINKDSNEIDENKPITMKKLLNSAINNKKKPITMKQLLKTTGINKDSNETDEDKPITIEKLLKSAIINKKSEKNKPITMEKLLKTTGISEKLQPLLKNAKNKNLNELVTNIQPLLKLGKNKNGIDATKMSGLLNEKNIASLTKMAPQLLKFIK